MSASRHLEIAAVLVSHGDRAGTEPNCTLMFHADAVKSLTGLRSVTAGVLKGEPSLEEALTAARSSGARDIVVYPLFMSGGYFTATVLPDRILAAGLEAVCRILPPLGLDPGIPEAMLADALETASRAGISPLSSRLLIVGHGSKFGPASAQATRDAADRIARAGSFESVATAFLEEEPFLDGALETKGAPTIVIGFFFGDGMHAGEDIPAAIRETGADAVYAGPVGRSARISELIAAAIHAEIRASAH